MINILFLLISLIDLLLSPRKSKLSVQRTIQDQLERGKNADVEITIINRSNKDCMIKVVDGIPASFQSQLPLENKVARQSTATLTYHLIATVRGKYSINKLYVRYRSFFGLWEKQATFDIQNIVKVIPDLSEVNHYLNSAERFLQYEGTTIRKQRHTEGEFSQIRNYVVGDDPRKINWRQTAKLQEIMMNEYEPEHGKYITILLDCGRMMGAELANGNRLEKALEASLTVAAAALRNGDYVAVLAFSKDIITYVPAGKGLSHLQVILQAVYNLKVDASEPNYAQVFNYLQFVQKRSFILLFSDINTFIYEESGLVYLKKLRKRHFFMMIGVKDKALQQLARSVPSNVSLAMEKSIAQQQMTYIHFQKKRLEKEGMLMIEAEEERLATEAVSRYIHVMNQGLL